MPAQIPTHLGTTSDLPAGIATLPITEATPANIAVRAFVEPAALDEQTAFYSHFLDILHGTGAIVACHLRTRDLLAIRDGYRLLDVGCGTGSFTCETAALVGTTGQVIGIDQIPALIEIARQRGVGSNLPVAFDIANAHMLPLADNSFDGCRVERVLQNVDDPGCASAEMVRVTRPGGQIVAAEVDWDTIIEDLPDVDRELCRRKSHAMSDSAGNGWMGRQLPRHFHDLALEDVTCEGFVAIWTDAAMVLDDIGRRRSIERIRDAGVITGAECSRLIAAIEDAGSADCYFAAFSLFLFSGRKPTS